MKVATPQTGPLTKGLYLLCAVVALALIWWGCSTPVQSSDADAFYPGYFDSGWSQLVEEEWVPLDTIQAYIPVQPGEQLVFTCTLPEIPDDFVLLFYNANREVMASVDGELVQSFTMQEGFEQLQTPGSAWQQVDLNSDMSGKECTLVFNAPSGDYGTLFHIYCIQNTFVNTIRMGDMVAAIVSVGMIFFSIVLALVAAIVWRQPRRKRYFYAITLYFCVVLLWLLAELNFYDIFLGRPVVSYLLGELFRRMIPLTLLRLVKNSTNYYWHPKLVKGMSAVLWCNIFVPFILLFAFGIPLLELRWIHYALSLATAVVLLLLTLEKIIYFKRLHYEEYPFLAVPILLLTSLADEVLASLIPGYAPFSQIWTAVGCIVFSIVTFGLITYVNSRMMADKLEIEQSYQSLENTALVQQLEVHFLFNTLNAISAYCKTDPAQADRAVHALASYLRSYLHLLRQHQNIPIEMEMDLVESYLTIQQMRFGRRLSFSIDRQTTGFTVPPFIVHTFVENSIKHGMKMPRKSTTVTVSIKQKSGLVFVTIHDDGVGFDLDAPIKNSSLGMRNAEKRLQIMKNGTVDVRSTPGEGTTIVLSMPLKDDGNPFSTEEPSETLT